MWTLRRSSIHLSNRGLSLWAARCTGEPEIMRRYFDNCTNGIVQTQERTFDGLLPSARFSNNFYTSSLSCTQVRMSSLAGTNSSGGEVDGSDDDLGQPGTLHDVNEDDLSSQPDDGVADDSLGTEVEVGKKRSSKYGTSSIAKAILKSPNVPVGKVLEKWIEQGNEVTQPEVSSTMFALQKQKMFMSGLQLSQWLESSKHIEFQEANYASHVYFMSRVLGPNAAEEYIKKIPETFRGELVFCNLLASYVARSDVKRSEQVFERMKKLGFSVTTPICNQLLFLYLKTDKRKIHDVLTLMEKEDVKWSRFTYWILIKAKGHFNDITGIEQVVESMKAQGVEPTTELQALMASIYVNNGQRDKADVILKEIEGDDLENNPWTCRYLIPVYASMAREDEVERIWNICEPNARIQDFLAAIEAWGKLKRVEKAEEVFEKMMKEVKKPFTKMFMPLLTIYANHKMLEKEKALVKQMEEMGCKSGPPVWDALVKLYIGLGDIQRAIDLLEKSTEEKKGMYYISYAAILRAASGKGDIPNAEKMVLEIKKAGYGLRLTEYSILLKTYLNAKTPAYGFVDRMRGDNVYPNTLVAKQLAELDKLAYRKSDLLDQL